jgi:hypothetical protein
VQSFIPYLSTVGDVYSPSIAETFSFIPVDTTYRHLYAETVFDIRNHTEGFVFAESTPRSPLIVGNFTGFTAIRNVKLRVFATPPDYILYTQDSLLSGIVFPPGFEYGGPFIGIQLLSGAAILWSRDDSAKIVYTPDLTAADVAFPGIGLSSFVFTSLSSSGNAFELADFGTFNCLVTSFSVPTRQLSSFGVAPYVENIAATTHLSSFNLQFKLLSSEEGYLYRTLEELKSSNVQLSSYNLRYNSLSSYEQTGKPILESKTVYTNLSSYNLKYNSLSSHERIGKPIEEVNAPYLDLISYNLTYYSLSEGYEEIGKTVEEVNSPYVNLSSYSLTYYSLSEGYEEIGKLIEEVNTPYVDLSSYSLTYYSLSEGYEEIGKNVEEVNSPYVDLSSYSLTYYSLSEGYEEIAKPVQEVNSPYVDLSSYNLTFYSLSEGYEEIGKNIEEVRSPSILISGFHVEFEVLSAKGSYRTPVDYGFPSMLISGFHVEFEALSAKGSYRTPVDYGFPSMLISGFHVTESLVEQHAPIRLNKEDNALALIVLSAQSTNTELVYIERDARTATNKLSGVSTNHSIISNLFPSRYPYF